MSSFQNNNNNSNSNSNDGNNSRNSAVTLSLDADDGAPTTTSTRSQTAELLAELNNEGASHLERGLYAEAISALTGALHIAMKQDQQATSTSSHTATTAATTRTRTRSGSATRNALFPPALLSQPPLDEEEEDVPAHVGSSAAAAAVPKKKRKKSRRRRRNRRHHRGTSLESLGSKSSLVAATSRHRSLHHGRGRRSRSLSVDLELSDGTTPTTTTTTAPCPITEDIALSAFATRKFVYSKPLRVRDRYNLPPELELASYMVYNLALAYQLKTVSKQLSNSSGQEEQQSSRSSSLWNRICQLYQLANRLQDASQAAQAEEGNRDDDDDESETSPLLTPTFTLALVNNLACALDANGKREAATDTWNQLWSQVWCMLDVGCLDEVACLAQILENAAHVFNPHHGGSAQAA